MSAPTLVLVQSQTSSAIHFILSKDGHFLGGSLATQKLSRRCHRRWHPCHSQSGSSPQSHQSTQCHKLYQQTCEASRRRLPTKRLVQKWRVWPTGLALSNTEFREASASSSSLEQTWPHSQTVLNLIQESPALPWALQDTKCFLQ